MDASGRVLLPAALREFAGIDKKAVLVGQGDKFEIWDEGLWKVKCDEWLSKQPEDRPLPIVAGEPIADIIS